MTLKQKRSMHEAFWQGKGPCLILIPPAQQDLYDLNNYTARFRDPRAMWESEIRRAEPVVDWPTDGIPTIRPNLGVTFIPAMAGLEFQLSDEAMPWPGEPLKREAIRSASAANLANSAMMRLAEEFYAIHRASGRSEIAAYHPDTQGVFDIAHLLNGDNTFYELAEPAQAGWIQELLEICLDLYVQVTTRVKSMLNEPADEMIHGHGTSQGVWFPKAGTRMSEDTAILLSPRMVERVILPVMRQAAAPFSAAFVHFCGKHPALLEQVCRLDEVKALDLGNPELYDTRWLFERCAETGTVLYSRVAAIPGESWEGYVRRLAALVQETSARVILRPLVFPESRTDCAAMQALWHELTQT